MPAEILSLDLDWFNEIPTWNLQSGIKNFFGKLKNKCVLPSTIEFVPEHQYLYPWSLKVLNSTGCRKMNVVNIDEHHDFYCLSKVDFQNPKETVGCWNFFAFMADRELMSKYTWVTNSKDTDGRRQSLLTDLKNSRSKLVREFKNKAKVVSPSRVFNSVLNKKFDGFMIIRSPGYTERRKRVYHVVEEALRDLSVKVRRYECRANFSHRRVENRANSLFWKL